jgi:2-C-methyl-D-erythritol 4-phosphate cytidylyltransferase
MKKNIFTHSGGKERQDSGCNAVKFLDQKLNSNKKEETILLFHNGANPFVSPQEIKTSIKEAKKIGASVVAHPTKDTIKKADKDNLIRETLDRSCLWNMQTPQTIKFPIAKKAFFDAKRDGFYGTDDVSLVERIGRKVKIIPASENNFKITTPIDLELAKIILRKQKNV